jgi:hypothetical protein
MHGDRVTPTPNPTGSWIDLSPWESDEFGVPRAYVQIKLSATDLHTWEVMDETALALAQAFGGVPGDIQYYYDAAWQTQPFPLARPFPEWHRGLGTTYHESGTLWIGGDATTSVKACDRQFGRTAGRHPAEDQGTRRTLRRVIKPTTNPADASELRSRPG